MVEKLFMTDGEIAKMLGLPHKHCQPALRALEKEGLPLPEPLFENRRYWPAVRAFFDRRYGLLDPLSPPPALDGEEKWASKTKSRLKRD
ncbi:winged helix-turn-helix domain-containing protein [Brucella tritici]|uniref:Winged helix-turn-helix domain-containing protein n=1 Tax=Brucella tritici TaxID=94626 RepID=A0A833CL51_9HYPH|nr:winged helix-turn-helix domain-containing protein [Brucella tritici]